MDKWKKIKVSDIGKVITGKTPKTSESDNYGGEIPFLTPSDDMTVKYVRNTNKTLTDKGKVSVKNMLLPANTVCVSCIGSDLGKVAITTKETITNQQINSIIVDTEKYNVDYIYYSMLILGKVLNHHSKTSTAVPIVNKTSFSNYEIVVPTKDVQTKTASILSRIDDKIDQNTNINNNLLEQASTLFNSAIQKSTSVVYAELGSLAEVKGGKRLPKGINLVTTPNQHPYIRVRDLNNTLFASLSNDYEYVDDETQQSISRYIVSTGDLLISIVGTIGLTAIVDHTLNKANLTENCVKLTNIKNVTPEYLLLFLRSSQGVEAISKGTVGAVQLKLPIKNIQSIAVPLLCDEELRSLNETLSTIFSQISANIVEMKQLADIRDTLLPRLISGELDISNIDL